MGSRPPIRRLDLAGAPEPTGMAKRPAYADATGADIDAPSSDADG